MNDYIKREDAVEAVWQILNDMGISQKHNDRLVEEVDAVLDEYTAADVRPVVSGRWNIVKLPPDPGYKAKECSTCKCNFWDLEEWNFCPNCGADMREES